MSHGLFAELYKAGITFTLIDTRERRDYVAGHWFGSINIPLSLFSTRLCYLFRSTNIPIDVLDWGDEASAEALHQLKTIGFWNVTTHKTSHPGRMGSGFVKGEFVWSKAFGEVVAHEMDLPEVTPQQYLATHRDALLFDVRPTAEYRDFTIPASQSLPNSLLLANTQALKDTGKMSLLHCAGRTRSIIGAFTLMASGYDGPFAVFRGGTQAWQLDGYEREHGANRVFAKNTEIKDQETSNAVARFLRRWQIPREHVPAEQLAAYTFAHSEELLFDVSDDAATGKLAANGIIKISGTNLVQQTDRSIARYHVPITLFDHGSGSRAAFAAFWLNSMGYTVKLVYIDAPIATIDKSNAKSSTCFGITLPPIPHITAAQLSDWQDGSIYDFRSSEAFQKGHITNSHWQNISVVLHQPSDQFLPPPLLAMVADSMAAASLIANCLTRRGWQIAGIYIWNDKDFSLSKLSSGGLDSPVDNSDLYAGRHHGSLRDAQNYLAWEENLPDEVDRSIHDLWCQRLSRTPCLD